MTNDVMVLHRELLCAVNEIGSGGGSLTASVDGGLDSLIRLLQVRDYKQAIRQLRALRGQGARAEVYGCCEEEDVEVLLLLYCKATAEHLGGGALAVVGSTAALVEGCSQLRETNLCLSAAVRTLSSSLRNPRMSLHSSSSHLSGPASMSINM